MKRFCLIVLTIFAFKLSSELRFYREDIHFTLTDSTFSVDGNYFFRNESEKTLKQILYYPFPQDNLYGIIDTVYCENISRPDSAKVLRWNEMGASVQLIIPVRDTTVMRIFYTQKLKGGKAEYILETTSAWGKGFEQAYYDLSFSKTIKLKTISYTPDDLIETSTHYKLIWRKKDFLPLENLIIEFE